MWNQAGHSQPQQQETTIQLQQAFLQTSLAHRECVQQVEGLQADRNALRQNGTKLPSLCLSGCSPCMVDLMSLDPRNRCSRGHRNLYVRVHRLWLRLHRSMGDCRQRPAGHHSDRRPFWLELVSAHPRSRKTKFPLRYHIPRTVQPAVWRRNCGYYLESSRPWTQLYPFGAARLLASSHSESLTLTSPDGLAAILICLQSRRSAKTDTLPDRHIEFKSPCLHQTASQAPQHSCSAAQPPSLRW
jgi:hypothetical protein